MGPRPDSDTPGINLNDNPPSYEDVIDPVHQDQNHPQTQIFHSDYCVPGSRAYNSVSHDKRQTGVVTLAPGLTQNPSELHQLITEQACLPPRPYIRIEGRSTETRRQGQETKRQPVVDFDFKLDLTRSLLPAGDPGEWREFHVVRDGDGERAFRGGRWPSHSRTDAKPKGRMDLEQADEAVLDATAGTPTLMGWCERFCHDPAPVKSYVPNNMATQLTRIDSHLLGS